MPDIEADQARPRIDVANHGISTAGVAGLPVAGFSDPSLHRLPYRGWFLRSSNLLYKIIAEAFWRRASASRLATALEASRVITGSARLVRMIGTRTPGTDATTSACRKERETLG